MRAACSACWHCAGHGLDRAALWISRALLVCLIWTAHVAESMRHDQVKHLQQETVQLFYHGFDNYMQHAFPEDELRPLTCGPFTREQAAGDSSLLDVLGNYSLTLVDSLSTLAILSSLDDEEAGSGYKAWRSFQQGVRDVVGLYGDGTDGPAGQGSRSRGFSIDSKVQVFETVIRGVGGLLSAHLFAVGELPIRGYKPDPREAYCAGLWNKTFGDCAGRGIQWDDAFIYDGQLLRLAADLAHRVLPAFYTPTALPYPRVNLRYGVPFYVNSPFNAKLRQLLSQDQKIQLTAAETAETCAAGAGSLVLEFAVLSRLTGDGRFEEMAKRAFWAVWSRRSDIDLIGGGIDAESGQWLTPYTGVGAGIDSFFEYAFKSHVLLAQGSAPPHDPTSPFAAYDSYFAPLSEQQRSPESFLAVYNTAIAALKRHLYRGSSYQYAHYVQGDIVTGATRAFWMDSLSAYFPGLLTLAGDVDAGAEAHILNAAIWSKYSGLPERWNIATGEPEPGMAFWGGRPEFVESTYYLYRATGDPWFQHVGEMVLRDMQRRCWTECGWAGLVDVRTGEKLDRMESFVLGETAKYLYLLFTPDHPLNHLDAPFVFSTEAHPLIIPAGAAQSSMPSPSAERAQDGGTVRSAPATCPAASTPPLGIPSVPMRPDFFHAASLARLTEQESSDEESLQILAPHGNVSTTADDRSAPEAISLVFPWTLPAKLHPANATCAPMVLRPTLDLSFPPLVGTSLSDFPLERVQDGILVRSLAGLRLGLIQDVPVHTAALTNFPESQQEQAQAFAFRIQVINNIPLGKDEQVYISRRATALLNPADANFEKVEDAEAIDLLLDLDPSWAKPAQHTGVNTVVRKLGKVVSVNAGEATTTAASEPGATAAAVLDQAPLKEALSSLMGQIASLLHEESDGIDKHTPHDEVVRILVPAMTSSGKGAAPPPEVEDAVLQPMQAGTASAEDRLRAVSPLPWSAVYVTDELCDHRLPLSIVRNHHLVVIKRGGCSFSRKISNIPAFRPSASSLQLVVVVSFDEDQDTGGAGNEGARPGFDPQPTSSTPQQRDSSMFRPPPAFSADHELNVRPLLDEIQTVVGGVPRPQPLSVVLIGGGERVYSYFQHAVGVGLRRRYSVRSQGIPIANLLFP